MRGGPYDASGSGDNLVDRADRVISSGQGLRYSSALIGEVLSQPGAVEGIPAPSSIDARSVPPATDFFDALVYPGRDGLRRHLERFFEVVAGPGEYLAGELREGDVVVRRAMGEPFGHLWIVAAPERWSDGDLPSAGLSPEGRLPGEYVRVVEGGARPHTLADRFVRRVTDGAGRVPLDQLVVRPVGVMREGGRMDRGEAAPDFGAPVEQGAPSCYRIMAIPAPAAIGFEFDLNYGASTVSPPLDPGPARDDAAWSTSIFSLEGKNVTTHRMSTHGFRLEGDGNRVEIATKSFELTAAGRTEMRRVMKDVLALATDLKSECRKAKADTSRGFPAATGAPRWFKPGYLEAGVGCMFPFSLNPKKSYYGSDCAMGASPQATFTLPLARIDALVAKIRDSERKKVAGRAWSAPPGWRQGKRSQALYDAREAVNKSRDHHLKAKTKLSNGDEVTKANFTPTLQGLMILMVSYLRTSELAYDHTPNGDWDYEIFAKAYLPLNVKNPFRLLYADLSKDEQRVFKDLYDNPRVNLWKLAKSGATAADKDNQLFPARVKGHQECWFTTAPTWDEFVEKTVTSTPLLRNASCTGADKKGEDVGCEVLFAPLSRVIPHEPGSRRVTLEMRRLGFNWVLSHGYEKDGVQHPGWAEMTENLFDLAL